MPRKRNPENKGLPARWRHYHGAYYYQVPPGMEVHWDEKKQFRLGKTLPEAYRVWSERLEHLDDIRSIGELLDRYLLQMIPTKAPKTQTDNRRAIRKLRSVFGEMPLGAIRPKHVYQYVDKRGAPTAAKREIEVLRHAFTMAVQWGLIDRHPFLGQVRLPNSRPRTRYVTDDEILAVLSITSKRKRGSINAIKAYIKIKLLTGLSRSDLLRLEPERDFTKIGIRNTRHKTQHSTGITKIYEWTDELRAAVDEALAARPNLNSPFLFCNRRGEGYINDEKGTARGWDSMWQRFMKRVMTETDIVERFTEHDLRAKCASDAKSIEHAKALLAHADSRTTQRWYRRKPERVKPLK